MLSADISGFTALSERLAAKGRAGAEELTDLINSCFTALIGAAERHGGEVLKFGGDAVLILFRSADHPARVAAAGYEMQQALGSLGRARRASLTMTVGAHTGRFDLYLAGTDHRELLTTGAAASEVIRLESAAGPGQVRVSAALAERLEADFGSELVAPCGGDNSDVDTDHVVLASPPGLPPIEPPTRPPVDLAALVPTNVARELEALSGLGGEHRLTANGFVLVQGVRAATVATGHDGVAEAFGDLIDRMQEICSGYGVTVLHTDVAEDGVKCVLCAGAPLSHDAIADGLVMAAREIADIDSPFVIRQGLQIGRTFAGFLGADHRRAYTLMGDPVNTAARMLGPAGDRQVVAVTDVTDATRALFRTEPLAPLRVKGKSEPVQAVRVVGTSTELRTGRDLGPLIGRADELALIDRALERGHGVVEFVGSAGLGKSRLMEAAVGRAERLGLPCFTVGASPYASAEPYGVLSDLLGRLLGLDAEAGRVQRGVDLRTRLVDRAPGLIDQVDALALPLGLDQTTGLLESVDIGYQRELVHRTIRSLLTTLHPEGCVIVVEDLHWIDDASGEVLQYLAQQPPDHQPVVLATRRNEGLFAFDQGLSAVTSVELSELTDDDVREIANRSAGRALSDYELDQVVHRASGNPLFAAEVATAISDRDDGQVPDSVETVIAGRIDSVGSDVRLMLRILAVWGDEFDDRDVVPLLAQLMDDAAPSSLGQVDTAGIVEPRGRERWGFTHALHREVAYGGLPYKRRREFHRAIGTHLEGVAADPSAIAALLSVHYERGGEHDRAWIYCREAGRQAESKLAQTEALDAYQRAMRAGRYMDVPNAELADTAIKLGDAAERAGRYDLARAAYRRARRLVPNADRAYLSTFRKLGSLEEREGRYVQAQRWYRRGMKAALEAKPRADRGEWLLLTVDMAGVEYRRGRLRAAWDRLRPLAADSRIPAEVRFRACSILQLVGTYLDEPDAIHYGALGLELVDLVRDPVLHGNLVNNLGIAQYFSGQWDAAADLYEESYHLRDGAGDVLGAVMALNNLGEIRSDQLRLAEARRYFEDGLRRGRAANTALLIHVLEANLGRLATRQGSLDEAAHHLEAALAGFETIGSPEYLADTELRLAELDLARRDWRAATERAGKLLMAAKARSARAEEIVPLLRIEAAVAEAEGDRDRAVELLHEARRTAEDGEIRYQRAFTLLELSVHEPEADHRRVALGLLDALGVDLDEVSSRS
jgi:class 3 adenylate cyclase/tetratricopeptide (TPR) repeat protein